MARAPILQLTDISLTFGGNPVFDGLNMTIQPGDRRLPDMLRKASEADARDAARRAQADKPGDAPDAKNSGENMGK